MKKFCVLTAGRSGSTALMNALASGHDVSVPGKLISCPDNELLDPRNFPRNSARFEALTGAAIPEAAGLLRAFLSCSKGSPYAGFKSMPQRDAGVLDLLRQFEFAPIVLERRDMASEIASFMVAATQGTWVRNGGAQAHRIHFDRTWMARVRGCLAYILSTKAILDRLEGAIRLQYEDLCDGVESVNLNAFFGRSIRFAVPKPPTNGATYVENWDEFCGFLDDQSEQLERAR